MANLSSMGVDGLEDALDGLELHLGGLLGELEGSNAHNILPSSRLEPKLDLPFGLRLPRHLPNKKHPKR